MVLWELVRLTLTSALTAYLGSYRSLPEPLPCDCPEIVVDLQGNVYLAPDAVLGFFLMFHFSRPLSSGLARTCQTQ